MADMRAVGLKVLKNRLSEYVRLAANGERILITDRDRVVAELIAPRRTGASTCTTRFLPTPCVPASSRRHCRVRRSRLRANR